MATKAEMAKELAALGGETLDPNKTTVKALEEAIELQTRKNERKKAEAAMQSDKARDPASDAAAADQRRSLRQGAGLEELAAPGGVTRRKVNRGSTRRITRALENFRKACQEFASELDTQVFITDEETGLRTGTWDFVDQILELPTAAGKKINAVTAPVVDETEKSE